VACGYDEAGAYVSLIVEMIKNYQTVDV